MAELGAGGPGAAALPPPRQWSRPGPSGEGRRAWQSQVGARGTHTAAGPPQRPLPGDVKHPSSAPVQVEASKDDRQNAPRAAATPRTGQPRRGCLGPRSRWLTRWRPVLQMWTSARRSRPRAAATSTARTPAAPSSAKVPGRGLSVPPAPGVKVEPRERPLSAAREPEAGGGRPLGHVGPVWRPCGSAAHAAAPASVQQRRDRLCRVGAGARRGPVPGSARGLTCCQRCSAWGLPRSPPASRRAPGGLARERGEGRGPAGCSAYTAAPCAAPGGGRSFACAATPLAGCRSPPSAAHATVFLSASRASPAMPVSERPPQRPSLTRLRGRCLHTERVRGTGFGESVLRRGTGAEVGC